MALTGLVGSCLTGILGLADGDLLLIALGVFSMIVVIGLGLLSLVLVDIADALIRR